MMWYTIYDELKVLGWEKTLKGQRIMIKISKKSAFKIASIPVVSAGVLALNGTGATDHLLNKVANSPVLAKLTFVNHDLVQKIKTLTGPVNSYAVGTSRVLKNSDFISKDGKRYVKISNFGIDKKTIAAFAWDTAGSTQVKPVDGTGAAKFQLIANPGVNGASGNAENPTAGTSHGYQFSGTTLRGQINWLTGWQNTISGDLGFGAAISGLKNNTNGTTGDFDQNTTTYTSNPGNAYRLTNVGRMLGTGHNLTEANGDVLDMIVTIVSADNGIRSSNGFGWATAEGGDSGGGIPSGGTPGSWNPAIAFGKLNSPVSKNAIGIYNLYTYDANMSIKFVKSGTDTEVPISSLNYWSDIDATQSLYENLSNAAYGAMGKNLSVNSSNTVNTSSTTDQDAADDDNAYLGLSNAKGEFTYHYHQQNTQDGYKGSSLLWAEDGIVSSLFGLLTNYDVQVKTPLPNPTQPDIVKNVLGQDSVNNNTNRPADIALGSTARNNGSSLGYLSKAYYGSKGDDKQVAGIGTDYSNDEGWITTPLTQESKDSEIAAARVTYNVNAYLNSSWSQQGVTFNPVLHYTDDLKSNNLKALKVVLRSPDGSTKDVSNDAIKNSGDNLDYTVNGNNPGDYSLIVTSQPTSYQVKYPNTANVSVDFTQKYDDGSVADSDWTTSGGAAKPAWSGNLIATNMVQVFPRVPAPNAPDVVKNVSGADVTAVNGYVKDGYKTKADDFIDSSKSYEGYYGKPGQATTVGDEIIWTPEMTFDKTWSYTDNTGDHSYNPQIHLQDTIQDGLSIKSIEVLVNGVSKGYLPASSITGRTIDYTWDGTGVPAGASVKFKITTNVTDAWQGKFKDSATLSVTSLKNVPGYTDGRSDVVNGTEETSMATPDSFKNLQTNTVSVISDQQPEEPVKNVMTSGSTQSTINKLSGYFKYNHKSEDNLNTAEGVLQRRDGQYEWVVTQYLNDYSQADGTTLSMDLRDDISGQNRLVAAGDAYVYAGSSNKVAELNKTADGLAQPGITSSGEASDMTYHVSGIDNKTRSVEIHIPVKLADKSAYVTDLSMLSNIGHTKVTVDTLPTNDPGATTTNSTNKVGVVIPATDPVKNVSQINSQTPDGKSVTDQNTRYTIGNNDGTTVIAENNVWVNQKAAAGTTKQTGKDSSDESGLDLTATNTRPQLVWALDQQLGGGSDSEASKSQLQQGLTIADVLDPEVALGYIDDKGNFVAGTSNDDASVIVYGVKADGSKVDETKNFDVKVSSATSDPITGGTTSGDDYAGQPITKISQQRLDLTAKDAAAFRQNYVAYHVEVKTVAHGGKISTQKIGNKFTSNIVWPAFNNMYTSNYVNVDRPKPKDSLKPVKVAQDTNDFGNRSYLTGDDLGDVTANKQGSANDIDNFGDVTLENPNEPVSFFAGSNVPADRTSNYKSYTISDDVNAAFEEQSVVGVYDVTEAIKKAGINTDRTEDVTAMLSAMYKAGNLSKSGSGVTDVSNAFDLTLNGSSAAYGTVVSPSSNKAMSWQVSAKAATLAQDSFYEDGLYIEKGANHMYNQNPLNGRYYVMLINAQPAGYNNSELDIPNQAKVVVTGGDNPSTKYTPWTVVHVDPPKNPEASKTTVDKADAIDAQTIDASGKLVSGTASDKSSGIVYSQEGALNGDEDGSASDVDGPEKNTLTSTREVTRASVNYTIPYVFDNIYTSWTGDDHDFRTQDGDGQFNTKADITIKGTSAITKVGGLTIDLTSDRSQGALMLAKMTTGHYAMQAIYLDSSNNGNYGNPVALQVIPLPDGWDKYDSGKKSDFMKEYADNLEKQLKDDGTGRDWDNISKNSTFKVQTWDSSTSPATGSTPAAKLASELKSDAGKAVMSYMQYLDDHKQKTSVVNVSDFTQKGDNAGATLVASDNALYYGSVFYGTNIQQLFDWYYNGNNTTDITVRNVATMSINNQKTQTNYVDTIVPKVKEPKIEKFEADTATGSIVKGTSNGQSTGDNNGGVAQTTSTLDQAATDATPDSKADGTADMTVGRTEAYTYGFKATVPGVSLAGFSIKDTQFKTDVLNNPKTIRAVLADGTDVSSDFNFGYDANGLPFMSTKSPKIADTYRGVDVWMVLEGVSIKKDANLDKYADKNKAGQVTVYTIPDKGALEYTALDPKNPSNPYDPADPDRHIDSNQVNVHLYQPADPQKFVSVDNGANWEQGTAKLKSHGDDYMWKTVYGNVNTKYLSNIQLTDYLESAQSTDDVKILYTSNDGKIVNKDVTDEGTVKTTVMDSPLVKGAKVVKYTWVLKDGTQINGDLQMVVENATLGDPSADELPYLVNEGKNTLGFGSDKDVIKIPNIAGEDYTDETNEQVSKKTNVPMVEVPKQDVADLPQKFVDVLDGGSAAINGQDYLTDDTDNGTGVTTPQAGKVTTSATVVITNSVGETSTKELSGIDVTDAYNTALKVPNLTEDAMKASLQAVVDAYAKDKGYVVGQTLSTGEKVTSITMGPLAITSIEDQAATDKKSAAGQAKDLKLVGGADSALSYDDAKTAGTYWSVAVYAMPMRASDKPVSGFTVTGANSDELKSNLNKALSDKKLSDGSKYQIYVQAVTTSDASQQMKPVSTVVTASQKVSYFVTAIDGTVTNATYDITYPLFDNGDGVSDADKLNLASSMGKQALINKYGQISWDASTGLDGTLNAGGFIHVNNWGTVSITK